MSRIYTLLSVITLLLLAAFQASGQQQAMVSEVGPSSARVSWPASADLKEAVRYRKTGTAEWLTLYTDKVTSCKIRNLKPRTSYEYQFRTGSGNGVDSWSASEKLLTIGRPNLLVILVDDGRYDNYTITGGPAFFQTPNINSIAEEGANFEFCFPSLSTCSPSRASIVTGTYPHHHGVTSNALIDTMLLPTVAKILQDSGYYTGFVGKYGFEKWPIAGYDYFLQSSSDPYWNVPYDTPTGNDFIPGHKTTVFTNAAKDFLSSVPDDQPFCLFLFHKAPHVPFEPRPADSALYLTETMPFPDNFFPYTESYPSYLYECHNFGNTADTVNYEWLKYYQLLAGVEWSVGAVLTKIENMGVLDSTLIMYTSDNGLLKGEHYLRGKQLAQEESIRLPMFIRYPAWYTPGTVISDQMVMNIDIAPTLIDAAGFNNPAAMDGWSIHDITTGVKSRKEFLLEFYYRDDCTPTMYAVRSFDYKYIYSACDSVVEEFYDLINDPKENINKINYASLQGLIQTYRNKLDTLRQFYGDTILTDTIINCKLLNNIATGIENESDDEPESGILYASIFPNPGHDVLTISWSFLYTLETDVQISDITGRRVFFNTYRNDSNRNITVDSESWQTGMYLISIRSGEQEKILKYVKQ